MIEKSEGRWGNLKSRRELCLWALAATAFSFLLVMPFLAREGLNVVTKTYLHAAQLSWQGQNPYLEVAPESDWFKYSPFFTLLYSPLASLSARSQSLVWAFLNCLFFWSGLFYLLKQNLPTRGYSRAWVLVASVVASFELDGSLRYQQINALLVGLLLFSFAQVLAKQTRASALLLALGANLKILPVLFAPLFARVGRARWLKFFVLGSIAYLLVIPGLVWGPERTRAWLASWFQLLRHDTQTAGLLDVGTWVLTHTGSQFWATATRGLILGSSLLMAFAFSSPHRFSTQYTRVLSLMLVALLLANPRTESPTFVFLSPAYFFTTLTLLGERGHAQRLIYKFIFLMVVVMCSLGFNDLWPHAYKLTYAYKTAGAFLFWILIMSDSFLALQILRRSENSSKKKRGPVEIAS